MAFELPPLTYAYNALEPYIDEQTMQLHHDKHHAAYVKNLNAALDKHPELNKWTLEDLMIKINQVPEDIRTAVRNNGGGHINHSMFWQIMAPGGGGEPTGPLANDIQRSFGSFESVQEQLNKAAVDRFGSGWAWLVLDRDKLAIVSTANQDSPLMEGRSPVLGVDVWEHAYYLKYQNRRIEYLAAWWNGVNWPEVQKRYEMLHQRQRIPA
jgi:Fe-Mn family superoxide dismutase